MSNVLFYNNSKTTLGSPVAPGDVTITLASGAGALFTPGPTGAEYFLITLSDALTGLNLEICKCTNVSGDVLTVVRAQEGTSAQSWLVGDNAQGRITAGGLAAIGSEATEADKLTTARNIQITGDLAWVVTFDGSANVTAAGTLATVNANVGTFGDGTHVAQLTANGKGLITGASSVAINFAGASVATAAAWTTPRNIAMTGDVAWNVTVDGSAGVTAAGTLATVNANVGSFAGGPLSVPSFTVNGKGLITAASAQTTSFKSANLGNPTPTHQYSTAHGLGSTPSMVQAFLVCTTTDLGYAVGAVVAVNFGGTSHDDGATAWASPANVGLNIGQNGIFITKNDGTGNGAVVTTANWQVFIRAFL